MKKLSLTFFALLVSFFCWAQKTNSANSTEACVTTSNVFAGCGTASTISDDYSIANGAGAQNGTAPNPSCGWGTASAASSTWMHFTYLGPPLMQYLYVGQAAGGAGNNAAAAIYSNDGCTVLCCATGNSNVSPGENASDAKIDLTTCGLTVGQTYLLRIYNEGNTSNVKAPQVRCVRSSPCGDTWGNPCVVSNINTTFTSCTDGSHATDGCTFPVDGNGAVGQLNCPGPGLISVDGNMWYSFTLCQPGTVTATIHQTDCNDNFGSQIWFLSGNCSGGGNFNIVNNQCSQCGCMTDATLSYSGFSVGPTYYVMIDSYGGNRCCFTLTMTGPVCILPIELLDFDAKIKKNKTAEVKWSTGSQKNNDYFDVEKSKDNVRYERVSRMDGAGNSSNTLFYSVVDEHPYGGTSYYRLAQTDYDGTRVEFTPVAVVNKNNDFNIEVIPSGDGVYYVTLSGDESGEVSFNVYDYLSRQYVSKIVQLEKGVATFELKTSQPLRPGVYFATATMNGSFYNKKFSVR